MCHLASPRTIFTHIALLLQFCGILQTYFWLSWTFILLKQNIDYFISLLYSPFFWTTMTRVPFLVFVCLLLLYLTNKPLCVCTRVCKSVHALMEDKDPCWVSSVSSHLTTEDRVSPWIQNSPNVSTGLSAKSGGLSVPTPLTVRLQTCASIPRSGCMLGIWIQVFVFTHWAISPALASLCFSGVQGLTSIWHKLELFGKRKP